MKRSRFEELLSGFATRHMLVVGDFFLDEYRLIDPRLSETSLETGLEAYQVVERRCTPGAAGNVCANLAALGCHVSTLGTIGQDGPGFDLKQALMRAGVAPDGLIESDSWHTPTYTKPLLIVPSAAPRELERQDIKNRRPLPAAVEGEILARLRAVLPGADGVVVVDQVTEDDCGVITRAVRAELESLAQRQPEKVILVDSRAHIGLFHGMMLKPNAREACAALGITAAAEAPPAEIDEIGRRLWQRSRRTVFLTLGADGLLVVNAHGCTHVPAVPVEGEIDIVGAGDSCMAALAAALACGALPAEAAFMGNLAASITIRQIGVTGTATPAQMCAQAHGWLGAG